MTISAVERDTGLTKDTLRVWERRYGFPQPCRDAAGERLYSRDEVDKLRVLRRLLDAGHRPGKIIGQPIEALRELCEPYGGVEAALATDADHAGAEADGDGELRHYYELLRMHDIEGLRCALSQQALRRGVGRFVIEQAAPLNRLIGEAWASGQLEVFEEHLYTESMQVVLRSAIASIPSVRHGPRVLLTTLPGDPHGLGLLMAEALLALEGCRCISLGVQTPLLEIAHAAAAQRADIVALSLSGLPYRRVAESPARGLAGRTELWAGGGCTLLRRRAPDGVQVLDRVAAIGPELARWRRGRAAPEVADIFDESD
ncbi:MAG TPA: MerR family transcriptional regulator [Burkholderiaceae bacterium]|nr:MerR family transcriptional regulator [Burkholderiaceae bacterium]